MEVFFLIHRINNTSALIVSDNSGAQIYINEIMGHMVTHENAVMPVGVMYF